MTVRNSGRRVDVVVVVPARDESARITNCVRSVRISLQHAHAAEAVGQVAVAVVGHNCTDDTLGRADRVLSGMPHVLVPDSMSTTVGQVRALGVRAALDVLPSRASRPSGSSQDTTAARDVWILSTDADSVVPVSWVTDVLAHARAGHHAVVGMARLHRASGAGSAETAHDRLAREAYRRIILAGIHGLSHDHVYGANLAVRADAYAAVGGFPSVPVGEDRELIEGLVRAARPLVRPRDVVVTTSGRRDGRAVGGLATLLNALDRAYPTDSGSGTEAAA